MKKWFGTICPDIHRLEYNREYLSLVFPVTASQQPIAVTSEMIQTSNASTAHRKLHQLGVDF
ncbi:MAG: hypothetical protein C1941_04025 [Prosthecochloris sp.]|nr:hypothetical protein [Prosthecochloris sp.]